MRFLIKFSYDGTNYYGYQKQPGLATIEGKMEEALTKINNGNIFFIYTLLSILIISYEIKILNIEY